jgi:hypothetical protein
MLDGAAVRVCPACGLAHEILGGELSVAVPLVARESTELAATGDLHYLAAWRLVVDIAEPDDAAWNQITRQASPGLAYLYVPAFSSTRSVLQRLGFRLTERQPVLEPLRGGHPLGHSRPELLAPQLLTEAGSADATSEPAPAGGDESGFGLFSPMVIGRQDARVLSHFVYQVLRTGETRELGVIDYRLDVVTEELVYIPAVWDPRCIHDANWRLLLIEFDDLVA